MEGIMDPTEVAESENNFSLQEVLTETHDQHKGFDDEWPEGDAVPLNSKQNTVSRLAYASRALSAAEKNYSITELETLAVVWAISHFQAYLYGHEVKILTDHSAVKTILEAPNLSGKYACWWLKVFGCGIGKSRSHTDQVKKMIELMFYLGTQ